MAQIVHQNRAWIVAHVARRLRRRHPGLYGALGYPLPLPANLSAYQLRQWGVTGDPGANGTLRVRASILNTAAQLQPYPLLRVTLADRFGKSIGTREFEAGGVLGQTDGAPARAGRTRRCDVGDPGSRQECGRVRDRRVPARRRQRIACAERCCAAAQAMTLKIGPYSCRPMCCSRPWPA